MVDNIWGLFFIPRRAQDPYNTLKLTSRQPAHLPQQPQVRSEP